MPAYNPYLIPPYTALAVGERLYLFNAETPSSGANSIVMNRFNSPSGSDEGTTFQIAFTEATPAAGEVVIYGSNVPPTSGSGGAPQNGVALFTSVASKQAQSYTDPYNRFAFYWANVASTPGGSLSVIAQR